MFRVHLDKIEGEGDFPCPKCGTLISPDDETEKTYTIIDIVMGDDDSSLERMVIRCNNCNSTISLDGFAALTEEEDSRAKISEALPESKPGHRTCHNLYLDSHRLGRLIVEYAQREDVEAFKRLRNLRLGEPFKGTITIENVKNIELKSEDFQEIAKAAKRRFKGLKDRDIYIVETKDGRKNFIGRASDL